MMNFALLRVKVMFLLTAVKILYILDSLLSPLSTPTLENNDQGKEERKKRKEDELLCKGHILNNLSNRLYDFYTSFKLKKFEKHLNSSTVQRNDV